MKITEWINNLGSITIVIVAGLLVWSLFFKPEKDIAKEVMEYWENRGFRTDTVHVAVDYSKLPKPVFNYTVPPAKVITYPIITPPGRSLEHEDLYIRVIDSLQNKITEINQNYLLLEPQASKILYGEFTKDSLEVDLLHIGGDIQTLKYGVNYNRFTYQWADGQLRANPFTPEKERKKPTFSLYGYAGYDLFLRSPLIKAEYNVDWRRVRFQTSSSLPTLVMENTTISLNLGYKIK